MGKAQNNSNDGWDEPTAVAETPEAVQPAPAGPVTIAAEAPEEAEVESDEVALPPAPKDLAGALAELKISNELPERTPMERMTRATRLHAAQRWYHLFAQGDLKPQGTTLEDLRSRQGRSTYTPDASDEQESLARLHLSAHVSQ